MDVQSGQSGGNNTAIIVAVVVVVAVVGIGAYLLLSSKTPPKTNVVPGVSSAPQATATTAGFPLQAGATGTYVTGLQNGLNQYVGVSVPVTGTFDAATIAGCAAAGFSVPVSATDYNTIIAPATAATAAVAANPQIALLQAYRGNIGGSLDWTPMLMAMSAADLNTLYAYCSNPNGASNAVFNAAAAVVKKYNMPTAGTAFD